METTSRRLRVKRGAEQWRVLLSRFDGSGLSVAEFCAREGISDMAGTVADSRYQFLHHMS